MRRCNRFFKLFIFISAMNLISCSGSNRTAQSAVNERPAYELLYKKSQTTEIGPEYVSANTDNELPPNSSNRQSEIIWEVLFIESHVSFLKTYSLSDKQDELLIQPDWMHYRYFTPQPVDYWKLANLIDELEIQKELSNWVLARRQVVDDVLSRKALPSDYELGEWDEGVLFSLIKLLNSHDKNILVLSMQWVEFHDRILYEYLEQNGGNISADYTNWLLGPWLNGNKTILHDIENKVSANNKGNLYVRVIVNSIDPTQQPPNDNIRHNYEVKYIEKFWSHTDLRSKLLQYFPGVTSPARANMAVGYWVFWLNKDGKDGNDKIVEIMPGVDHIVMPIP